MQQKVTDSNFFPELRNIRKFEPEQHPETKSIKDLYVVRGKMKLTSTRCSLSEHQKLVPHDGRFKGMLTDGSHYNSKW